MSRSVVLDACVLVPYDLANMLLTLAEGGLYEPRWSEQILDETERALTRKLGLPEDRAHRRVDAMRRAFPEATVAGYEALQDDLTCHEKDRHVLASAIASDSPLIVTANLKDFPESACAPHGINAIDPDLFLLRLAYEAAESCARAVTRIENRSTRPAMDTREVLARLARFAPTFANTLHQQILSDDMAHGDAPALVMANDDDVPLLIDVKKGFDPTKPLHVAALWWQAVGEPAHYATALNRLSHEHTDFGDYMAASVALEEMSMVTTAIPAVDAPQQMTFVRFIPEVPHTSQVFSPGSIGGAVFMTLIALPDKTWRVCALGNRMRCARDFSH